VRRRLLLRRRSLSVEQQHDALPEPEREAPSSEAERLETEHVLVEPLHLVLLIGCVVQNGLEHTGEPEIFGHDAKLLVLTEAAAVRSRASSPSRARRATARSSTALRSVDQPVFVFVGRAKRLVAARPEHAPGDPLEQARLPRLDSRREVAQRRLTAGEHAVEHAGRQVRAEPARVLAVVRPEIETRLAAQGLRPSGTRGCDLGPSAAPSVE
jgi:hypothetical protein